MLGAILGAVGAIGGGIIGLFSGRDAANKQQEEIRKQQAQYEALYNKRRDDDLAHADRNEAYNDIGSVMENNSSRIAGEGLDIQAEGTELQNKMSDIQAETEIGSVYENLARSGTRGGSLTQAVEQQLALNEETRALDSKTRDYQLESAQAALVSQSYGSALGLQQNQDQIDDVRESYGEGGINTMQHGFQIGAFNDAYNDAEFTWTDAVSSFFGGASAGFNIGAGIGGTVSNWMNNPMENMFKNAPASNVSHGGTGFYIGQKAPSPAAPKKVIGWKDSAPIYG